MVATPPRRVVVTRFDPPPASTIRHDARDRAVAAPARARNDAVDWLRGAVMVLMALDHTRGFLGTPVELETAAPALFFTRWVTHFCAPVFVLLAGMGAYLHGRRLASPGELAAYLAKRGLWLVLLEVTVVRFAWSLRFGAEGLFLQVIWAIGVSMVVLAALVWLPRAAIAAFALLLIGGHDLFDGVHADGLGAARWLWVVLHEPGVLSPFPNAGWFVIYPLVPWVGVMAAGYALGPWAVLPRDERRARFMRLGAALIVGFVVLRATNLYGDPQPWSGEQGLMRALLGFLDCRKYPPSLLYLAMTLGPALCVLAWMDRPLGPAERWVSLYGRVPLFYYVLHILLIHLVAVALAWPALGGAALARPFMFEGGMRYPLPVVYVLWIAIVAALYLPCRWFAGVKRRSTGASAAWLSYL